MLWEQADKKLTSTHGGKKKSMSVFNSIRVTLRNGEFKIKRREGQKSNVCERFGEVVNEDDGSVMLCVMIVRRFTNLTVTRRGLQISPWHVNGTVTYCLDGLNGNLNLDTDCMSITSHITLILM